MHLLLIVIAGVIIAHMILNTRSNGCGCLIIILVLLLIGALASH